MSSLLATHYYGITPASIEKYLLLTGWDRIDSFQSKRIIVFALKEDNELKIAIPSKETFDDYYLRLEDVIRTLSILQSKTENEVIESLRSAYTDRIQLRIIDKSIGKGKLPLDYAANCLEGLRDLVLYAACAEENAQPVCVRMYNNAKSILEKFQFGQTGYGSFVINVEVQVVDEENEQLYLFEVAPDLPIPNEHKVVRRINTAIQQVDRIVNQEVKVSDLIEFGYEDGITANMCDALSKLKPLNSSDIKIEATIRYAEAITHSLVAPVTKILEGIHFSYFEEISKRYRDFSLIEDVNLIGSITMLSKENHSSLEEPENTIRLLTIIDNRTRLITLHLSPQNHILACNAYRDNIEVEVTGTIDKSGKRWFFSEVHKFTVLG